jgi:hypothetical protein
VRGSRPDTPGGPRFGVLLGVIAGFVVAGVPLVALAWHNVNHLLAGDVGEVRVLIALAATAGLGGVLFVLARLIERWTDVKRET